MARQTDPLIRRKANAYTSRVSEPRRPVYWTRKTLVAHLRDLHEAGEDLSTTGLRASGRSAVLGAGQKLYGTYAKAVEAAGFDYDVVARQRRWTRQGLLKEMRQRHRAGESLAPNLHASVEVRMLLSAAVRLFGSYRAALEAAGVNPAKVYIRPQNPVRLTPEVIVQQLRERHRAGQSLMIDQKDPEMRRLYESARRRFGSYANALAAAGLDPAKAWRPGRRTAESIVQELRQRHQAGQSVAINPKDVELRRLYNSARYRFGTYAKALRAAGIDPAKVYVHKVPS